MLKKLGTLALCNMRNSITKTQMKDSTENTTSKSNYIEPQVLEPISIVIYKLSKQCECNACL